MNGPLLDEIEARAKNTLYVNPNPEKIGRTNYLNGQDVDLLIRAVRQWMELAEARRGERAFAKLTVYNKENWKKASARLSAAVLLDPDVLGLLKGDQ